MYGGLRSCAGTLKCEACDQSFKAITNTHLAKHRMTMGEYLEKFSGSLLSEETRQKKRGARLSIDYVELVRKRNETLRRQHIELRGTLTPRQLQICYGGLLGDFGIHAYSKKRLVNNYLECYHGPAQVEYLKWIQQEFKNFNCQLHEWTRYWKEYGREYPRSWITTASHPAFTELRKFTYQDEGLGKHKRVTQAWLDKLEPLALAVWFMDDGGKSGVGCQISTQAFTYWEHKLLQRYFMEKWEIPVIIRKAGIGKDGARQYYLYIGARGRAAWKSLIRPHLLPMFLYKMGE